MFIQNVGPELILAIVSALRIFWTMIQFDKNRVKYWLAMLEYSISKDAMTKHRIALQASSAAAFHYRVEGLVLIFIINACFMFELSTVAWVGVALVLGYCLLHWLVVGRSFSNKTTDSKIRDFKLSKTHPANRAIRFENEFKDW